MLGLADVVHEPPGGVVDPGIADIRFAQPMSREARAVVETIIRGLQDLARTEPDAVAYAERA